jgi:hypothetical protein
VTPPFSFNLDASYSGNTHAFFVADEWQLSKELRVDLARAETQRITGTIANVSNGDLDADPTTLYNNNLAYFNGTNTLIDSKLSRTPSPPAPTTPEPRAERLRARQQGPPPARLRRAARPRCQRAATRWRTSRSSRSA